MMVQSKTLFGYFAIFWLALSACSNSATTASETRETAAYPEEELGWKLGAQAYTFRLFTFFDALDKIDSADLRFVEAFPGQTIEAGSEEKMTYELSQEGRNRVKQRLKEKGITLYAYGVVGAKDEAEWEKIFDFASDMGIQVITTEPSEDQLDYISKLCDQHQIRVAIHNHPEPSHYWQPEVVLNALDGRSELMGAAADVGHWMRSGLDPLDCLKKLDGKIYHLHFKDLNEFGTKEAHDVVWGTGKLPLKEIQNELKRQDFDGMLSAEYEYNWENSLPEVTESAANFRAAL